MNYRIRCWKMSGGGLTHVVEWFDSKGVVKLRHEFNKREKRVDDAIAESYEILTEGNRRRNAVVSLAFKDSRKRLLGSNVPSDD